MSIRRFEDIEAWQSARKLVNLVYDATQASPFDQDYDLRRQLRRAAISTMANIAEGFDGGTDSEFQRFLRMALRSATEVQSHLYVALDRNYLTKTTFQAIYKQAQLTRRLIGGFIRYLRTQEQPTGRAKKERAAGNMTQDPGPRTQDRGTTQDPGPRTQDR